jgi:hypothetical protein
MENLDRDKLSESESESSFGQNISQSESWTSDSSAKSELDETDEVENPACGGCYY